MLIFCIVIVSFIEIWSLRIYLCQTVDCWKSLILAWLKYTILKCASHLWYVTMFFNIYWMSKYFHTFILAGTNIVVSSSRSNFGLIVHYSYRHLGLWMYYCRNVHEEASFQWHLWSRSTGSNFPVRFIWFIYSEKFSNYVSRTYEKSNS